MSLPPDWRDRPVGYYGVSTQTYIEQERSKEAYITRPDDIDLGSIWNDMRRNQREIAWKHYCMNVQMANFYPNIGCQQINLSGRIDEMMSAIIGEGIL